MTNEEKAKERARQVFPCPNEDEQRRIVELAYNDACGWKDNQFKEYLEKKNTEISNTKAKLGRNDADYMLYTLKSLFIDEIINELFEKIEQDNSDREE